MAYDPTAIPEKHHKLAIEQAVNSSKLESKQRLMRLTALAFAVGFILGLLL